MGDNSSPSQLDSPEQNGTAEQGTMKAAVVKGANKIVVERVAKPVPGPREVLVRVKTASFCHSDLSIVTGEWGDSFYPQILGHEAVGVIEELGPDTASYGLAKGDLIGAPLWHGMCLECAACKTAGPQFCPTMKIKGVTAPGYFAEYTLVDAASAVKIPVDCGPGGTEPDARALFPVFCAGITVWDALERAHLAPGETVAIFGAGGLGQTAVKYAAGLGAKVVALDIRDEQLQACKGPGLANETINVANLDVASLVEQVLRANQGALADVVIVTSGAVAAYQQAVTITRPLGRLVMVGLPAAPVPFVTQEVTSKCLSITGAKVPGAEGAKRCVDFTVRKGLYPVCNPRKFALEDLDEIVALMKAGKVDEGRSVVQFF